MNLSYLNRNLWSCIIFVRPRKRESLFYGRNDLLSRVGQSVGTYFFKILFFFLVAKMTPRKHWNYPKSDVCFGENFGKKDFQVFSKIFSQLFCFVFVFDQKWLILHIFRKLKKKNSQNEKSWLVALIKQGFLFSWSKGNWNNVDNRKYLMSLFHLIGS